MLKAKMLPKPRLLLKPMLPQKPRLPLKPRLRMKLPPVRSVDHNIESMRSFAAALLATCQLADTPDAPLQPSTSACRWCAAREVCPAKARAPKKVDADFAALIGAG
jgi:hypothetical protein